jgi:hypothetical protein
MLHSLALWAILQKGGMGVAECIVLALEEECDDLVGASGGG